MSIQVQCPNCQRQAEFPDAASGKTARCKCGQAIPVNAEDKFGGFVIIESADPE